MSVRLNLIEPVCTDLTTGDGSKLTFVIVEFECQKW